jgi:hypothetical protein
VKYILVVHFASYWLLSCHGNSGTQGARHSALINEHPLDSLTKQFLAHAHDSADTWSDTLVSQLTRALRAQGVDTILYHSSGCAGCDILVEKRPQDCSCNTTEIESSLYWQYRGRSFVKKLDCCRNYPATLTTAAAFDFYYQNQKTFAQGPKFYRDFERYNREHPTKPRFLPSGPIHDLDVSFLHLRTSRQQVDVYVRGGEYDSTGVPRFLDYPWRRKQWQWAKLLDSLSTARNSAK